VPPFGAEKRSVRKDFSAARAKEKTPEEGKGGDSSSCGGRKHRGPALAARRTFSSSIVLEGQYEFQQGGERTGLSLIPKNGVFCGEKKQCEGTFKPRKKFGKKRREERGGLVFEIESLTLPRSFFEKCFHPEHEKGKED